MSSSSDCDDRHFKLDSSRLVALFEEMQAIGFPMLTLEQNVPRLKKGAPAIFFAIYKHLYRTFRPVFDSLNVTLEPFILNSKIIDREGFIREFFQVLRRILQLDQALPLYQYICPGHPVAKTEEILELSRRLRNNTEKRRHNSGGGGEKAPVNRRERQRDSAFASNHRAVSESGSFTQPLHPARIVAPPQDIPWRVVREVSPVRARTIIPPQPSNANDGQSPEDEGFRSRNPSSLKTQPPDNYNSREERKLRSRSSPSPPLLVPERDQSLFPPEPPVEIPTTMDKETESGFRAVLERFEQTEALQNLKFQSIEDRLIRMEQDVGENSRKSEQATGEKMEDHETRLRNLEKKYIVDNLPTRSRINSVQAEPQNRNPVRNRTPEVQKAPSELFPPSPPPSLEKEVRRRNNNNNNQVNHSSSTRSMSVSRSLRHFDPDRDILRLDDSGISSNLRKSSVYEGKVEDDFQDVEQRMLRREIETRIRGRTESRELLTRKSRRHRSVDPNEMLERMLNDKKEESSDEEGILMDLNERIQLRLQERIKTAEDTLNACMATIKKDYVLLRRNH